MEAHRQASKFPCQSCIKGFTRKQNLVSHTRSHTSEKPFHCDECDYKTARKDDVRKHVHRVHRGIKKFACGLCDRYFGAHSSRNRHVNCGVCLRARAAQSHVPATQPGPDVDAMDIDMVESVSEESHPSADSKTTDGNLGHAEPQKSITPSAPSTTTEFNIELSDDSGPRFYTETSPESDSRSTVLKCAEDWWNEHCLPSEDMPPYPQLPDTGIGDEMKQAEENRESPSGTMRTAVAEGTLSRYKDDQAGEDGSSEVSLMPTPPRIAQLFNLSPKSQGEQAIDEDMDTESPCMDTPYDASGEAPYLVRGENPVDDGVGLSCIELDQAEGLGDRWLIDNYIESCDDSWTPFTALNEPEETSYS